MLALSILVIAGGGQAPAQGGVPKADWQADSGALASPGEVLSTGVNPAVQALVDDLGVLIDDGDVGEVADIDGRPSGYASFVVTTGESAAKLYWKGDVPARVTEVVAAHPDVETTISSVEWTLAELVEGRDIALEILTSGEHAEFDLQTVGPQPDATGLLVQLGDNTLADAREVESIVAHATRIQVFVETGVHMVPAATRVSDTSPFSGGALIRLHAGSDSFVCSTGVAVVGKTSGNEYMTTAAHCIGGVKSETGYTSGAVKTYNGATTIGSWDHNLHGPNTTAIRRSCRSRLRHPALVRPTGGVRRVVRSGQSLGLPHHWSARQSAPAAGTPGRTAPSWCRRRTSHTPSAATTFSMP